MGKKAQSTTVAPVTGIPVSARPAATAARKRKLPTGATQWAKSYFVVTTKRDGSEDLKRVQSDISVPVDKAGLLAGELYHCFSCEGDEGQWFPIGLRIPPVCELCDETLVGSAGQEVTTRTFYDWMFPDIPWAKVWEWNKHRAAAAGVTLGVGVIGYAADHQVHGTLAHAAQLGAEGAFVAGAYYATRAALLARGYQTHGNRPARLDRDDPEKGKGYRENILKRARAAMYTAAVACGWIELTDALGIHEYVLGDAQGRLLALGLAAAGIVTSRPLLRWFDAERARRSPVAVNEAPVAPPKPPAFNEDGIRRAQEWQQWVVEQGKAAPNTVMLPERHRPVVGGWAVTIRGLQPGALSVDMFTGDTSKQRLLTISQTYNVRPDALNFLPSDRGEVREVEMLVQPNPPLAKGECVRDLDHLLSLIDVENGRFNNGTYVDANPMYEPLFKSGWGARSKAVFGTTGSGKSEDIRQQMVVENWAGYRDPKTGLHIPMYATFLQDFKRFESFGEFRRRIHAAGCTREDAYVMLGALLNEMERRYDLIGDSEWEDEYGRPRDGGIKYDPRLHGPILSWVIDEFHEIAKDSIFMGLIAGLARKMRACGIRITVGTHLGTLGDLGDRGFRDMLAGGYACYGRTTDSLTTSVTGSGQMSGDPRTLPKLPGMCYAGEGDDATKLGRRRFIPGHDDAKKMGVWELFDYLYDRQGNPIGYQRELPQETLDAFGVEWQEWAEAGRVRGKKRPLVGSWTRGAMKLMGEKAENIDLVTANPDLTNAVSRQGRNEAINSKSTSEKDAVNAANSREAIQNILLQAGEPIGMVEIDRRLKPYRQNGLTCGTSSVRNTLTTLVKEGWATKTGHGNGAAGALWELSDKTKQEIGGKVAEQLPELADAVQGALYDGLDPRLLMLAIDLVVTAQLPSVSMLIRKLRSSHAEAVALMEWMERKGIVSQVDAEADRRVLVKPDALEDTLAKHGLAR